MTQAVAVSCCMLHFHRYRATAVAMVKFISVESVIAMSEELISAVKLNKILYDTSQPEYRNNRKKNKIWCQIGINFKQNGKALKARWKNLRDSYAKHLRSQEKDTGQTSVVHHYKSWPWAQQMEFLKPYMKSAGIHSNVRYDDESETSFKNRDQLSPDDENMQQTRETMPSISTAEEFCQPEESVLNKTSPSSSRKRKQTGAKPSQPSPVEKVLAYFEKNTAKPTDCYDDIDLICLGYAKTIKKFSPRRQAEIKFKIAQIIRREELNHQLEGNNPAP